MHTGKSPPFNKWGECDFNFYTFKCAAQMSQCCLFMFQMQFEFQQQLSFQTVSLKEEQEDQQLVQVSLILIVCPDHNILHLINISNAATTCF